MLAKSYGSAVYGVDAHIITIEVNVGQGTKFYMVGLPDSAVKESQQRVETAIKYFGYKVPRQKVSLILPLPMSKKKARLMTCPLHLAF